MIKIVALLVTLVIAISGCSKEFREDFKQLSPLRNAVISEFDAEDVRVTIQNGNCIGVSFVNSKYNSEPKSVQDDIRKRTLELISSNYRDNERINMAWVCFVKHKKYFFLVNYTDSTNIKFYDKAEDDTWEQK